MEITRDTTRLQLAAIVVEKLREHGINAVLVGGSLVSIYTNDKYESRDLDFISSASQNKLAAAMRELGFKVSGKDFLHPNTDFTVEFPAGPLAIGDDVPVIPEGSMEVDGVEIKMLSPTQSVMDRLMWFFSDSDRQCLDQAVWIAEKQPIDLERIRSWAKRERQEERLKVFLDRLKTK